MKSKLAVLVALVPLGLAFSPGPPATEGGEATPLVLSRAGVMYVGGREVEMRGAGSRSDPDVASTQTVGQAAVHTLVPAGARKSPVVMVPGLGLTSWLYLGTPDGREGWAQLFARAGHPVYVLDPPNTGASGFDVDAAQGFMRWSNESVWRRWGLGPSPGIPYPNSRYPVAQIDRLHASLTPVVRSGGRRGRRARGDGGGRFESPADVEALLALLEAVGPATLVVHSAAGPTGFEVARRDPGRVRGIVAIEVTGAPTNSRDVREHFGKTNFLAIFGDYLDTRRMAGRIQACEATARLVAGAGGRGEVIRLTKLGIHGNGHLLMQDDNNHEIASMILRRIAD